MQVAKNHFQAVHNHVCNSAIGVSRGAVGSETVVAPSDGPCFVREFFESLVGSECDDGRDAQRGVEQLSDAALCVSEQSLVPTLRPQRAARENGEQTVLDSAPFRA